MFKKLFLYVLPACSVVLFSGCLGKPESYGEGTTLFIVADEVTWQQLEEPLRTAFERTLHTPQEEKLFNLFWVAPDEFNDYAIRRHLAIVGVLESNEEISQKVRSMLSEEVRSRVEDGSAFVFPKMDPWAKGQKLLVLAGTTLDQLDSKLTENADYLHGLLETHLHDLIAEKMFAQLEQKELSAEILRKFGWTMRIQHDYFVNTEREDANFFMLRRSLPGRERWIFVHWIEDGDPANLSAEWAIRQRNVLTSEFCDGDKVYQKEGHDYRTVETVELASRRAIKVGGLWINDKDLAKATGGPFSNYTFYDEQSGRIYMIDLAVWFPGGDKGAFLRQLDIIAHSFRTADDLKREADRETS